MFAAVVWKTVGDDLQANIWERQHMDQIVPSILFNLHDTSFGSIAMTDLMMVYLDAVDMARLDEQSTSPRSLADQCLRELIGKASFGSINCILRPVLSHCDDHQLWTQSTDFVIETFQAIMYSIQTQYSYFVIQVSNCVV
jgi:hypothetical protein